MKEFFARLWGPRVLLALLGIGLVVALIWLVGPLVGLEEAGARWLATAGAGVLFGLIWLLRWFIIRRRGAQLQADLDGQGDSGEEGRAAEIEAMREKMNEAIAALKSSELSAAHGTSALYALPWYMIIGPSAAGKSTLLRQSGLSFPYSNDDDIQVKGFGGTRNCDWWFSDQAILLDTAGRYTTEEEDREEWLGFLSLLRRRRRSTPINGVLVAISISEVLTAEAADLERHVKILRERIDELMQNLGLVFPVFIVFTKCDLIKGFEAFFEDLSEREREQLWGAYLLEEAVAAGEVGAAFERKMEELHTRLCELRLRKMAMQRDLARKATVFDFPHQFAAASARLSEFVALLFRDNPYQETPRFAGVYFTSGTQEGTPIERLVGNLRQAFGFAAEANVGGGEPKPFFIKNLFTEVIFPLRNLVRANRRRLLLARALKTTAMAAALSAVIGCGALLASIYAENVRSLAEGNRALAALAASEGEGLERYRVLERLYAHYAEVDRVRSDAPVAAVLRVRTAHQQLPLLRGVLEDELEPLLRAPALAELEARLERYGARWQRADSVERERLRGTYYRTLQVYLMTTLVPERLDPDLAAPLLADLWSRELGLTREGQGYADVRERAPYLEDIVRFQLSLGLGRDWQPREAAVANAQAQLRTAPDAGQLYTRLLGRGNAELGSLGIDDLLSGRNRGQLSASRSLPTVFTARAWEGFVQGEMERGVESALRGDWVLGDEGNADGEVDENLARELRLGIRERYFRDYAEAWFGFLGGLRPVRPESLTEASIQQALLARPDGPVGELMATITRNIDLNKPAASRGNIRPPKKLKLPGFLGKLYKKGSKAAAKGEQPEQEVHRGLPELEVWLGDLRRFSDGAGEGEVSAALDQYFLLMGALVNDLERIGTAGNTAQEAVTYSGQILGGTGSGTALHQGWVGTNRLFTGVDGRTRGALEGLLKAPLEQAWGLLLAETRRELSREWQDQVAANYRQGLNGRFPFSPNGPDAVLTEVAEFFRPDDGLLWSFVGQRLAPFLSETRQGWQERRWLDAGLGFSNQFLNSLRGARAVSASLFGADGGAPGMAFQVYPLPTQGISETLLEASGSHYRYRNEPQEWRRFVWPGGPEQTAARVIAVASNGSRAELRASGHWGLLHLLRDAELTNEGNGVYLAQWRLQRPGDEPLTVRFRLRAERQQNLFDRHLHGFRIPSALFTDTARGNADLAGGR